MTEKQLAALENKTNVQKKLLKQADVRDNIAIKKELDISFVTADTVKNLFKFI